MVRALPQTTVPTLKLPRKSADRSSIARIIRMAKRDILSLLMICVGCMNKLQPI